MYKIVFFCSCVLLFQPNNVQSQDSILCHTSHIYYSLQGTLVEAPQTNKVLSANHPQYIVNNNKEYFIPYYRLLKKRMYSLKSTRVLIQPSICALYKNRVLQEIKLLSDLSYSTLKLGDKETIDIFDERELSAPFTLYPLKANPNKILIGGGEDYYTEKEFYSLSKDTFPQYEFPKWECINIHELSNSFRLLYTGKTIDIPVCDHNITCHQFEIIKTKAPERIGYLYLDVVTFITVKETYDKSHRNMEIYELK